jgi:Mg2+ and Co2+ transporter CorA
VLRCIGNFKHRIYCYIPLDINRRDVEKCVKAKMKPHLLKLTTDTVCYSTLKDLKEEIINCIEEIKDHICHCTLCKKTYKFNNLTSHECNKIGKFIDVDKNISSVSSKVSKSSKKGSKLAKSSKKGSKLAKSSKKGSKLAKSSKSSKKGSKKKTKRATLKKSYVNI